MEIVTLLNLYYVINRLDAILLANTVLTDIQVIVVSAYKDLGTI